jgi:hypothetical protein
MWKSCSPVRGILNWILSISRKLRDFTDKGNSARHMRYFLCGTLRINHLTAFLGKVGLAPSGGENILIK